MKIVHINSVPNGSTGTIMFNIHSALLNNGDGSYVVWGRGRKSFDRNEYFMNDMLGVYLHKIYTLFLDRNGFGSKFSTKKLICYLDKVKPDIIHLHNIHGYYINIDLLFNYIKKNNIKVVWTLHDCWPFTGHCSHFLYSNCDKWKSLCFNCPCNKQYPKSFLDNSKSNYLLKKKLFTGVNNLVVVTPSEWLASLVKKSFLSNYDVRVINNGIDTSIFRPLKKEKLLFRKKFNLENKKIILGVAAKFNYLKGFDDFINLSHVLDDDYFIVLVGLNKKQIINLPKNVIGIENTHDVYELVDIYNSSDVFLNLTYEDNYPTVNLEAVACGTPVITYDTGGSTEFLKFFSDNLDPNTYIIKKELAKGNPTLIFDYIKKVVQFNKNFKIIDYSIIDKKRMIDKYLDLYKNI